MSEPENIRVLIADDHAVVRKGLITLINTEPGMELVGEAEDGVEVVSKARSLQPDVILLDLVMPRRDGIDAIQNVTKEAKTLSGLSQAILLALGVYLVWTAVTYLLEGRISLVHHPTPGGRATYVLLANVVIGIGVAVWALRMFVASKITTAPQLGFRSLKRTSMALLIAFAVGGGLFFLQSLPSTDTLVLFNGFAQVLPVSMAEVVVCWAVIGGSFEAWAQSKGKVTGIIVGTVAANFLFGLYHFAHSAPFNQVWMVFFLMIPGLVTSLVYFLGRDLYATIILHNFLGMTGVMQNVDLDRFSQPLYHLYFLLIVSVGVLVIADNFFIRRLRRANNGESLSD